MMQASTEYTLLRKELTEIIDNSLSRTARPLPPAHVHSVLQRADSLLERLQAAMLAEPLNAEASPAQQAPGHNERLSALIAELQRLRQQATVGVGGRTQRGGYPMR
jgi:predicted trehalose synthase